MDSLSMKALPKSWIWTRLGDVAETITGTTPPKNDLRNYGNFIPFVKPSELCNCVVSVAEDNLSEKGAKLARICPANAVLVSCIGNLGKTGINSIPVAFNQQINAAMFPTQIFAKYGFYYLQTVSSILKELSSATTVTIVNKSKFNTVPFPLPPLPEQHRIVAKIEELFTRLDAGIEALRKIQLQLKRYRHSVLKAAFCGDLTAEWRRAHKSELEPISFLLEKIKAERNKSGKYKELLLLDTSDLPALPEGWEWVKLSALGTLERGKSKHRPRNDERLFGGKYPFIQTGDIRNSGGVIRNYTQTYNEVGLQQSRLWAPNTLCITIAANIAETALLSFEACFPDSVVGFMANEFCEVKYVRYYFELFKDKLDSAASATAQKNINLEILNRVAIPLCSLSEQRQIVGEIERHFSTAEETEKAIEQSTKQADRLRQSILKRAFEGKLVPQNPYDEPAEKLLERIKAERLRNKQGGLL